MVIKYYGHNGEKSGKASTLAIYFSDPYKNVFPNPRPSYCVWIVPGTVDTDGNDITA